MSMTREEAIKWLEETIQDTDTYWESCSEALQKELDEQKEVFLMALSALRPVSREKVEKVWRGCEYCKKHKIKLVRIEMDYNETPGSPKRLNPTRIPKFCPICGAPLTDEAVEMVMERLEALHENRD